MIDVVVDACRRYKARVPRHLLGYQAKTPLIAFGRESSKATARQLSHSQSDVGPDARAGS